MIRLPFGARAGAAEEVAVMGCMVGGGLRQYSTTSLILTGTMDNSTLPPIP